MNAGEFWSVFSVQCSVCIAGRFVECAQTIGDDLPDAFVLRDAAVLVEDGRLASLKLLESRAGKQQLLAVPFYASTYTYILTKGVARGGEGGKFPPPKPKKLL